MRTDIYRFKNVVEENWEEPYDGCPDHDPSEGENYHHKRTALHIESLAEYSLKVKINIH